MIYCCVVCLVLVSWYPVFVPAFLSLCCSVSPAREGWGVRVGEPSRHTPASTRVLKYRPMRFDCIIMPRARSKAGVVASNPWRLQDFSARTGRLDEAERGLDALVPMYPITELKTLVSMSAGFARKVTLRRARSTRQKALGVAQHKLVAGVVIHVRCGWTPDLAG